MPYISRKQKMPSPKTRLGWTLYRWACELRNDAITSFDWRRDAEWLLRRWVWFTQYHLPIFIGACAPLPNTAHPLPEQPVQCTRRAFDYLGFRDCLTKPHVELVDLTIDPIKTYVPEGIALTSGQVCHADLIILATGYHLGDVLGTVKLTVDGTPLLDATSAPNFFIPLLGCPLFCIPPRVCEDSMYYFVREYHRHAHTAARILFFPQIPPDPRAESLAQKHHVVFSPHCASTRYFNTQPGAPNSREPSSTQDFKGGGVPRFLVNMWLRFGLSSTVATKSNATSHAGPIAPQPMSKL